MSIPVTADAVGFTPKCLEDFLEEDAAPMFKLRHSTLLDRQDLPFNMTAAKCIQYTDQDWRDAILRALRRDWVSDGLEQNITQLEALWEAREALGLDMRTYLDQCALITAETPEGTKPQLPPVPVLDFDERLAEDLDLMVEKALAESDELSHMDAMRDRWNRTWPRMILRMLLKHTTLDVSLNRKAKVVAAESLEELFVKLERVAKQHGIKMGKASVELLNYGSRMMFLSGEEEKNSSAPPSGATSPSPSTKGSSKSKEGTPSSTQTNTGEEAGEA